MCVFFCPTVVHCPWLPAPVNGSKSTNDTAFGTIVHFACHEGLGVVGSLSIVCESSGNWSGFVPVCRCKHANRLFRLIILYVLISSDLTNISVVPFDVNSSSLLTTATASVVAITTDEVAFFSRGQFNLSLKWIPLTVPARTPLLIVVKDIGYSTVTKTFAAYSSEGTDAVFKNCLSVMTFLSIGYSLSVRLRRRQYLNRFTYNSSSSFNVSSQNDDLPAWVNFEENSLNVSSGTEIEISLHVINPFESLSLIPQLFALNNSVAQRVNLDSFSLLEIDIREREARTTVGLNRPAQLRLGIDERAKVSEGDRISAWFYSDSDALWKENGEGLVSSLVNDQLVWTTTIDRLGWWNCDRTWTETACISTTVSHLHNGVEEPLPGALIILEGDSFNYGATASTSLDGRSCLETQRGQTSSIWVRHEAFGYDSRDAVEVAGLNQSSYCGGKDAIVWRSSVGGASGTCEDLSLLCKCISSYFIKFATRGSL